ncbi:MAG: hypothetical protein M3P08_02465 [Thermoproteota archaeon]|jgi:hypothetical protein|nr:hypothetical protein [Thermoproteota archaeon]
MTSETLDSALGMERLEDLEEHLESILQRRTPIVSTELIAMLASRKNFDPEKERRLIEKSKTTKCRCCHYSGTRPWFYRTCRHLPDNHYVYEVIRSLIR